MAGIKFASDNAIERFQKCKQLTESMGDDTLMKCIGNLMNWKRNIIIGCDHDEMSFTFREEQTPEDIANGYTGINGGIIYHGQRDGFGSGEGPTHSVTIDKAEGYRIHT